MPPLRPGQSARGHAGASPRTAATGAYRGDATGRRSRASAPARRHQSSFAARRARPAGFIARMRMRLRATRVFALAAALLLALTLGYGLHRGGHIAAFAAAATAHGKAAAVALGLQVEEVTVEGRRRADAAEVLQALDVSLGTFIFDVDLAAARGRLEQLPWVEHADVGRRLPGRIHVRLVEREPYAVWQLQKRLALVDRTGAVLTRDGLSAYAHLPLVVGRGAPRAAPQLMTALAAYPAFAARIEAAVRVSDRRWNLKLRNGIEVRLAARDISDSLEKLLHLDAENGVLSRDIRAIDLRVAGRITILVDSDSAAHRRAVFQVLSAEGGRET